MYSRPKAGTHTDLEYAGRLPVSARQIGNGMLDAEQAAADFLPESFAGFSQAQAACTAVKQPHPHMGLQPGDILADCRCAQPQPPCGSGEAALFGCGDKTFNTGQRFHSSILNIMFIKKIVIAI